jgi:hypothetical protein
VVPSLAGGSRDDLRAGRGRIQGLKAGLQVGDFNLERDRVANWPPKEIPALIKDLDHADRQARLQAMNGLWGAGAEGRPAVLTGYRDIHGLVTMETFDVFRKANFSGRGVPARSQDDVVSDLLALERTPDLSARIPDISSAAWTPRLREILSDVSGSRPEPDAMATEVAEAIERGAPAAEVFNTAARSLSREEMETLYRVAEG